MKRLLLVGLLAPVALSACSQGPSGGSERVSVATASEAFCRPTPNGRQMTGCYLTLRTTGPDRLVSVSSPIAGRVEIHESKIESGMMMMTELKAGLPLPADQPVELKPGGNHIMLLGVSEPLTAGQTVPLTLRFEVANPIEVVAEVRQPTAE
ncbi:copper chaperone PCu(A)C [Brevundimonas kwangchunensis]|uniref:Copper chaperone PCu(A)C n=1 Tax=Brevundimonas kwangchunensis TaxID=322163 RepID=A0ABN1GTX6_9CAUL